MSNKASLTDSGCEASTNDSAESNSISQNEVIVIIASLNETVLDILSNVVPFFRSFRTMIRDPRRMFLTLAWTILVWTRSICPTSIYLK